ncbi:MAG: WXG100 family type VII secretion target [Actinomycetaceae bacterium]
MSTVEAGEGALENAAGMVDDTKQNVEAKFTQLGSQLQGIGAAWTGQARTAFDRAMVRWDEEARSTNNILTELASALRGTQQSFTQQDESDSSSFNTILG